MSYYLVGITFSWSRCSRAQTELAATSQLVTAHRK